ncbi:hypothetical protein HYT56_00875, partial [Candidatus Woesearchaeota archaeon]|nr:hypothetical protein [Candidatus Woesearchaeota archaeon]
SLHTFFNFYKEEIDFAIHLRSKDTGFSCSIANKDNINARFHYNPLRISEKKVEGFINEFKKRISISPKLAPHEKTKGIGFGIHINNTILMELILNSLNIIRNSFNKNIKNKEYKLLIDNFFAKLLTGDGTLDINIRNYNYPSIRIKITDKNSNYLKSYKRLMSSLNFLPKIKEKNILVQSCCGIEQLLYLYKIEAFKNTNNWNKLLLTIDLILKGRRLSTLKRYLELTGQDNFDTITIAKKYKIVTRTAYDWLDNAIKTGYIKKVTTKYIPRKPTVWTTTDKAKILASALEQWEIDLTKLKQNKKIQNSYELFESLKTKGKNLIKESP